MRFLAVLVSLLLMSPVYATTVAWSGTEMAADSQRTGGHVKYYSDHKIVRSNARHATMGAAGAVFITDGIKEFFLHSDKPMSQCPLPRMLEDSPESVFAILIVYDDGTAAFYTHTMQDPSSIDAPFAFGSGEDFALAIMSTGGSAKHAVEVAERLDLFTGGAVHVFKAPATKR